MEEPLSRCHRASRAVAGFYLHGLCRIRVEGAPPVAGPYILSMNHRSALDPLMYAAILPRRIRYMTKFELSAYPVIGAVLSRWCVFIRRGRYDRNGMGQCEKALRDGFVLSVFPEGTRHARLSMAHAGAVLLASRTGVPVIPGAILGSYRPLGHLTVRFGAPLHFPPRINKAQREEGSQTLLSAIIDLGATPLPPRPSDRHNPWA